MDLASIGRDAGAYSPGIAKAAAGVMCVSRDGRVLMMRRNGQGDHRGEWAFPGGHAEVGEAPGDTAVRELMEETGHAADPRRLRHVGSTAGSGIEFHTHAYPAPAEFQPAVNDEHDAFMWAPINQLPQPLHPGVVETLGTDLTSGEVDGLKTLIGKWLDEEAAEPAHAEDAEFREEQHPRDHGKFASIHRDAAAIKALPEEKRDNMHYWDHAGGTPAHNLYEAQRLLPNPSDKLKRVTDRNSMSLTQEYDFVANVDGHHYGISKYEDPDSWNEEDEDKSKYVFAYQRLDNPSKMIETHIGADDVPELMAELRKHNAKPAQDADFKEGDHPRGKAGRFSRAAERHAKLADEHKTAMEHHNKLGNTAEYGAHREAHYAHKEAAEMHREASENVAELERDESKRSLVEELSRHADRLSEHAKTNKTAQDEKCACHKRDPQTGECVETVAMDRASARSFDKNGHLVVKRTPVSKAAINEYYGREIPGAEQLGLEPNRRYRLLRDPHELNMGADSWSGKPLMISHKPVSADNHPKDLVVGSISSPEYVHPYLFADLSVWDRGAIDAIESGRQRELSSAYHYTADMTPGVYEGQAYDGVMRALHANHVALVRDGRAGSDVVVQDEKPRYHYNFGAFAMAMAQDKKPAHPISFSAFAMDGFEESKHPRGKAGKFAQSHARSASVHKQEAEVAETDHLRDLHKEAAGAHEAAAQAHLSGDKRGAERASQSAHWASDRVDRETAGHHADKAAHGSIAALATSHLGKGEMKSSAETALSDSHDLAKKGDHYNAAHRARKSLAYSVGIGHPDYAKATAAMRGARKHTKHLEVVPHNQWVNSKTGAKASVYGAVPYTSEAEKPNWEIKQAGHTIRDNKANTVGLGHTPFSTPEEAEHHIDKIEERQRSYDGHRPAQDASWEESKHPRANNGQFGAGEGKSHDLHARHHEIMSIGLKGHAESTKGMSPRVQKMKMEASKLHKEAALAHTDAHESDRDVHSKAAHVASEKAHTATEAAHQREMLESYGAGSGKSSKEHVDYHTEEARKHFHAGKGHGKDKEGHLHGQAELLHARAALRHMDAKTDDDFVDAMNVSKQAHEASKEAHAHTAEREKTDKRRDQLTKKHSAFKSFKEMAHAEGGYRPSIETGDPEKEELAKHYDDYQTKRGDPRRAFRYGKNVDKAARAGGDKHKTGDGKVHESKEAAIAHANEVHRKTGNIISVEKA